MKMKKGFFLILIGASIGYLIYNYFTNDYSYGMMNHHHGYYDNYSSNSYYLNSFLMFISYLLILVSILYLLLNKTNRKVSTLYILNQRLSKGEISIEDYQKIKGVIKN